jgi:actin-like ATPase involved in cell morphogenesis
MEWTWLTAGNLLPITNLVIIIMLIVDRILQSTRIEKLIDKTETLLHTKEHIWADIQSMLTTMKGWGRVTVEEIKNAMEDSKKTTKDAVREVIEKTPPKVIEEMKQQGIETIGSGVHSRDKLIPPKPSGE